MEANYPTSSTIDPVELLGDSSYYYGSDSDSGSSTINDYSMMIIRYSIGQVRIERNMDMAESSQYGTGIDNLTDYLWAQLDSTSTYLNAPEITNPSQNQEYVYFVPYNPNINPIVYNSGLYHGIYKAYYCQCRAGASLEGTCVAYVNSAGKHVCEPGSGSNCTDCIGYFFPPYSRSGLFIEAEDLIVDGNQVN